MKDQRETQQTPQEGREEISLDRPATCENAILIASSHTERLKIQTFQSLSLFQPGISQNIVYQSPDSLFHNVTQHMQKFLIKNSIAYVCVMACHTACCINIQNMGGTCTCK